MTKWHSWLFLTNWETLILTLRVNDWTAFAILAMFVYLSLILVLKVLEKKYCFRIFCRPLGCYLQIFIFVITNDDRIILCAISQRLISLLPLRLLCRTTQAKMRGLLYLNQVHVLKISDFSFWSTHKSKIYYRNWIAFQSVCHQAVLYVLGPMPPSGRRN